MSGPGDTVRRGPDRWMRAAVNAIKNPNSHAARLYRRRTLIAAQVTEGARARRVELAMQPHVFLNREFAYYDPSTGTNVWKLKRDYVTCSVFCTTMQMQLVFNLNSLEEVTDFWAAGAERVNPWTSTVTGAVKPLDRSTLSRKVRCQVCATEVTKA